MHRCDVAILVNWFLSFINRMRRPIDQSKTSSVDGDFRQTIKPNQHQLHDWPENKYKKIDWNSSRDIILPAEVGHSSKINILCLCSINKNKSLKICTRTYTLAHFERRSNMLKKNHWRLRDLYCSVRLPNRVDLSSRCDKCFAFEGSRFGFGVWLVLLVIWFATQQWQSH